MSDGFPGLQFVTWAWSKDVAPPNHCARVLLVRVGRSSSSVQLKQELELPEALRDAAHQAELILVMPDAQRGEEALTQAKELAHLIRDTQCASQVLLVRPTADADIDTLMRDMHLLLGEHLVDSMIAWHYGDLDWVAQLEHGAHVHVLQLDALEDPGQGYRDWVRAINGGVVWVNMALNFSAPGSLARSRAISEAIHEVIREDLLLVTAVNDRLLRQGDVRLTLFAGVARDAAVSCA